MKKYSMFVFSNPVEDQEDDYLKWYAGQHIHDLLRIPGFLGCRFFKVAKEQMFGTKEEKGYSYLMIWDWETDDIQNVYKEIRERKKDGRSKTCPSFKEQLNFICVAATDYIKPEDVTGMNVEEVTEYSRLFSNVKDKLAND